MPILKFRPVYPRILRWLRDPFLSTKSGRQRCWRIYSHISHRPTWSKRSRSSAAIGRKSCEINDSGSNFASNTALRLVLFGSSSSKPCRSHHRHCAPSTSSTINVFEFVNHSAAIWSSTAAERQALLVRGLTGKALLFVLCQKLLYNPEYHVQIESPPVGCLNTATSTCFASHSLMQTCRRQFHKLSDLGITNTLIKHGRLRVTFSEGECAACSSLIYANFVEYATRPGSSGRYELMGSLTRQPINGFMSEGRVNHFETVSWWFIDFHNSLF